MSSSFEEVMAPTLLHVQSSKQNHQINEIQLAVYNVNSKSFYNEVSYIFPSINLNSKLIAISTMQHALHDLIQIGDHIEVEKDRLLLAFYDVAERLFQEITVCNKYWLDYIDPCSGLPVKSEGQKVFSEVECAQVLLGYNIMNAGCCKIILHPEWGSSVYPASIFTSAPSEVVIEAIKKIHHNPLTNII